MTTTKRNPLIEHSFICIIAAAILAQLIGTYHARSFIAGGYFFTLWVVMRIAFPIAVLAALRVPFSRIGLGRPLFDRTARNIVILAGVLLVAAFAGIYFMRGYFSFYSNSFAEPGGGGFDRFVNFMIFTSSTLTGWEFLHRSFLLMGISYVLVERERISAGTAATIAIGIVWVFEVVFHFIKPEVEALGLLVGSPFLSWVALRTRSIWIPFLLHFFVELLFIAALIMQ